MKQKIFPQEALKLIACITMLIDHFGVSVLPQLPIPHLDIAYNICRIIGRLAFPIYCFLLVEGMRHTRGKGKYLLRLGVGILLAEVPFDLLFEGGFTWAGQNVMVTLTLGACMLWCMEKTEEKALKVLLILPFAMLAEIAKSDYGAWGVVMIAAFALFDRPLMQLAALALVNWQLPTSGFILFGFVIRVQMLSLLAMIPIGLYNGKKCSQSPALQWGFYLFYPLHLLVLWLIRMFIT